MTKKCSAMDLKAAHCQKKDDASGAVGEAELLVVRNSWMTFLEGWCWKEQRSSFQMSDAETTLKDVAARGGWKRCWTMDATFDLTK